MDKQFQTVVAFVKDKKNRNVVIATAAGLAVAVAGIAMFTAKRGGKTKR